MLLYIISSSQATVKMPFTVSSVSSKVFAWFDAPFRLRSIIIRGFPHVPRANSAAQSGILSSPRIIFPFRVDFEWTTGLAIIFTAEVSRTSGFCSGMWIIFLLLLFLRLLLAGIMLQHFRFLVSAFNDFRELAGLVEIVILCNTISD